MNKSKILPYFAMVGLIAARGAFAQGDSNEGNYLVQIAISLILGALVTLKSPLRLQLYKTHRFIMAKGYQLTNGFIDEIIGIARGRMSNQG
jgi:hypothetical protein